MPEETQKTPSDIALVLQAYADRDKYKSEADALRATFGSGSSLRIVLDRLDKLDTEVSKTQNLIKLYGEANLPSDVVYQLRKES